MSLGAWRTVPLTADQARAVEEAYGRGEFDTELLLNRYRDDPWLTLARLDLLPQPALEPVHFTFEGNRTYAMQMVTNGVCHGLAYHQQVEPDAGPIPWITYRLELLLRADLPFLTVRTPTPEAVVEAALDGFASRVLGFQALGLPEQQVAFGRQIARWPTEWPGENKDLSARIERILNGVHPREVFATSDLAFSAPGDDLRRLNRS